MIYEITTQNLSEARSSMIYKVYSDNGFPSINNPYILTLVVWRGDINDPSAGDEYKLKVYPDILEKATFNISDIIQGYFSDIKHDMNVDNLNDLVVNYHVTVGLADGTDTVSDTPFTKQAQYGYNLYYEDVNALNSREKDGFMTTHSIIEMPTGENFSVYIARGRNGDGRAIRLTKGDGTFIADYALNMDPVGESNETLHRYEIDLETLDEGTYKIQILDSTGSPIPDPPNINRRRGLDVFYNTSVGDPITIKLKDVDKCKYYYHKLNFINIYGVWDTIYLFGAARATLNTDFEKGVKYVDPDTEWLSGVGSSINFNKSAIEQLKYNTGWIHETEAAVIKQLFLSDRIVMDGISVRLIDKSFITKRKSLDKVINYELVVEASFFYMNSI